MFKRAQWQIGFSKEGNTTPIQGLGGTGPAVATGHKASAGHTHAGGWLNSQASVEHTHVCRS